MLDGYGQLLEAMRRLLTLAERVLERGEQGQPLSAREAADAHEEIATTSAGIEQLDAMLTVRRQGLRVM